MGSSTSAERVQPLRMHRHYSSAQHCILSLAAWKTTNLRGLVWPPPWLHTLARVVREAGWRSSPVCYTDDCASYSPISFTLQNATLSIGHVKS